MPLFNFDSREPWGREVGRAIAARSGLSFLISMSLTHSLDLCSQQTFGLIFFCACATIRGAFVCNLHGAPVAVQATGSLRTASETRENLTPRYWQWGYHSRNILYNEVYVYGCPVWIKASESESKGEKKKSNYVILV